MGPRPFLSRLPVVLAVLSTASVLAGGCTVGPNYVRPAVEQPTGFKSQPASEEASPITTEWWRLYRDPGLDELVATANSSNQNLRQAVARLDEARALARIAAGDLYPTLSIDPIFVRQRTSENRASATTGQRVQKGVTFNDWLVPFDLAYELDVWGRIRRSLESANAQLAASADDLAVVRLTVETDVAQAYYTLRSLDAQSQILTQNVESYREQVRILSVQLKNGLLNPLDLSQAEAQLQATLTQQRDVERARADEEHVLAILCGRAAPSFGIGANALHEASPPSVPPGLPAELLHRRPDVAEAEQNVVAANAQIGVATAEFYPRFTLTSAAGFESLDVATVFNWQSRVASIAPSISFPIFEGGKLTANLEATEARYQQAVAAYTNQVLLAYGDVEDALTDVHAFSDEVGTLHETVTASREYHRLAQVQFNQGLVDYLTVIDAERTLLGNQLSLAQTVNLQMAASIHLIKALGGGWNPQSTASH
jgi:multidrug efflux system outer membrane protein